MIFPKTILTRHAADRLASRSSLSREALVEMLDQQLGHKIGCTAQRTHLAHRLFWSPADAAFLVAIQDVITGTVLTFLTERMYENRYLEQITASARQKVLAQAASVGYAPTCFRECARLHCRVLAKLAGAQHTTLLGRWSSDVELQHITQLGACQSFWRWVIDRIRVLALPLEALEAIVVQLPEGNWTQIRYAC